MAQVRELLLKDKRNHLAEETKEKLSFLGCNGQRTYMDTNGVAAPPQLSAIQEINTTGKHAAHPLHHYLKFVISQALCSRTSAIRVLKTTWTLLCCSAARRGRSTDRAQIIRNLLPRDGNPPTPKLWRSARVRRFEPRLLLQCTRRDPSLQLPSSNRCPMKRK